MNEGASSSVNDLYRYIIIRRLLHYILNILPVFTPMVNSDVLTKEFLSVRLPVQFMIFPHS
jgi:hypothetical protein